MNNDLDLGLDRWQSVATTLNQIIEAEGAIDINNPAIWSGILHKWDNQDWELALIAVGRLLEKHPQMFKDYHKDAFITAANTLVKYNQVHDRVLDKRIHKKIAWKMIMTMREVWNQCGGIYLPNENSSRKRNEFLSLFE